MEEKKTKKSKDIVYTLEGGEELTKAGFLKYFEKKVRKTIRIHELVDKKDKLMVAVSGGKDSTVVLYLINKICKNRNVEVEALHIDQSIGEYSKLNRKNITDFCKKYKIKLHAYSFREYYGMSHYYMSGKLRQKGMNWKSCTVCGVFRRSLMNRVARDLKATKLVTGHNLDDEAQNVLMNIMGNKVPMLARLGPKPGVKKVKGFIQRIKPLYMCLEEEVKLYSQLMEFPVQYQSCPCRVNSYRKTVQEWLDKFDMDHIGTKYGIVNSYLALQPVLKKGFTGKVQVCKSCGEPSSKDECQLCMVVRKINE